VNNARARASAGALDPLEPYSLTFVVARFIGEWAYFPVLALLVTTILGKRESFAPWVVVHNWTLLLVVMAGAAPRALLIAGAPALAEAFLLAANLLLVYGFVRAAKAALDAPWTMAMLAGAADLIALLLVDVVLWRAL
jgi:hypothetical protein